MAVTTVWFQLLCGGEAALHAHTPTETSDHQDRSPVHHQSPVTEAQQPSIIPTAVIMKDKQLISSPPFRLLVKLPEVDYQLKVKTTFDKYETVFNMNKININSTLT